MTWLQCTANTCRRTIPSAPGPCHAASLLLALVFLFVFVLPALTSAQESASSTATTSPSQPISKLSSKDPLRLTLQPGKEVVLEFEGHSGLYRSIRLQQVARMAECTIVDPAGNATDPRTSDGGAGSVVEISVLPATSGTYQLKVLSREKHAEAQALITLSDERTPTEQDRYQMLAENSFAYAERLRRSGKTDVAEEAIRFYRDALANASSAQEISLQRQIMVGHARFLMYRAEQYQEAVTMAQQAASLSSAANDIAEQALAEKTLATALAFTDRYPESIDATRRALKLYRQTGDLYWQGILLGNLAFVLSDSGNSAEALIAAGEALSIARQLRDDYGIAFSQSAMGEIHQSRGEYQEALGYYFGAMDQVKLTPYPQVEGEVWANLGELYSQLGDMQRAADAYHRALPLVQKSGDAINELQVLGHLGELSLNSGKLQEATAYYSQGLARAREQKLVREQAKLLIGMARTSMKEGDAATSLSLLREAVQSAHSIRQVDGEASAHFSTGEVLQAQGRPTEAAAAYSQAASLWRQIPNSAQVANADYKLAALDYQRGDLIAAKDRLLAALDQIESSRQRIASNTLQTSFFASRHNVYELTIDVLMRLDDKYPSEHYSGQAWEVAERARARNLLDSFEQTRSLPPHDANQELLHEQESVEEQLRAAEDHLAKLGTSRTDLEKASRIEEEMHGLILKSDQLEARLKAEDPRFAALTASSRDSSLHFRQSFLDAHSALLEYWAGPRQSYLWIFTRDREQSYRLPSRSALSAICERYQHQLLARDEYPSGEDFRSRQARISSADAALHPASQSLLSALIPQLPHAEIQRLIIVADGPLLSVPFNALEYKDASHAYLIQHYEIVNEPSAMTMASLLTRDDAHGRPERVAIFADPVYNADDPRVSGRSVASASVASDLARGTALSVSLNELPRLPATRREAMAIATTARIENTSLHLDFDSTPEAVEKTDWQKYLAAHFASHALVNSDQPELSGIVLSMVDRDGSSRDGVLWLHDIYKMRIPVRLVTLSACNTGRGGVIPGEGMNGLARAFLFAGAHTVVSTLWSADDSSSDPLMSTFYRDFLSQNASASEALRSAQLSVMTLAKTRAPYYWAQFQLQGDWRVHE